MLAAIRFHTIYNYEHRLCWRSRQLSASGNCQITTLSRHVFDAKTNVLAFFSFVHLDTLGLSRTELDHAKTLLGHFMGHMSGFSYSICVIDNDLTYYIDK